MNFWTLSSWQENKKKSPYPLVGVGVPREFFLKLSDKLWHFQNGIEWEETTNNKSHSFRESFANEVASRALFAGSSVSDYVGEVIRAHGGAASKGTVFESPSDLGKVRVRVRLSDDEYHELIRWQNFYEVSSDTQALAIILRSSWQ